MLSLRPETIALLDDIESRIDPETEDDFAAQWYAFLHGMSQTTTFSPCRKKKSTPGIPVPRININDALADVETMLVHQLADVSNALNTGHCNLCVRTNYGTGILSSLFGAEIFEMPREMNTLPTTKPFNDSEVIRELVQKGMPDLENGFGARVWAFAALWQDVCRAYPKIAKYVSIYHPDLQGPLDICELMWGCEMFYAMYDEPELVHDMLSLITDTYAAFLDRWFAMFPCGTDMNVHWSNMRHRGRIMLRCDSAMNLSPEFYEEFAMPYDAKLLEHFGGGAMHFCGRGDHYIELLCSQPKLYSVNLSQPHLNDMEVIWHASVDRGITVLGFPGAYANEHPRSGGYHGLLHT